jgi:hypothetical protein
MSGDRPSWKEIDRMRDGSARREKKRKDKSEVREHSTRYDKYKADLNRLFDQGMAGELIKKLNKKEAAEPAEDKKAAKNKAKDGKNGKDASAASRRKGNGRIPKDSTKSASRFRLIRAVIDAGDRDGLLAAVDELVEHFGLPDDFEVLVRVLEHPDEELVRKAVDRMAQLLPATAKVPRRASLKERLRSIGQTAADSDLRQQATELETRI